MLDDIRRKLPDAAIYAIFILVNTLFVFKYGVRLLGGWTWMMAAIYAIIVFVWLRFIPQLAAQKAYRTAIWVVLAALMVGAALIQYSIDPLTLRVDRWDGLHCPIAYLMQGQYPYMAQNHLGGYASPFPVWMLLHIPFYLLGNVGLSVFAAIALFLFSIKRSWGAEASARAAMMLAISIGVWYEIAVRSDLITNMLVCAAVINWLAPYLKQEWVNRYWAWIAVGTGLLASSRLVVLVPVAIVLFPFYVKLDWRTKILLPLIAIGVFLLTFAPLALWDPDHFFGFEYAPWRLQTRHGYPADMLLYIPLGIFLALRWSGSHKRMYANCALILIAFWGISVFHRMVDTGVWDLFSSYYDITYFSTAMPFCIMALLMRSDRQA